MDRICNALNNRVMTANEAAQIVKDGDIIGVSGFTLCGYPKEVPKAIAQNKTAKNLKVLSGASVGDELDGEMAREGVMSVRYPYQSNKDLRKLINKGEIGYSDMHLSHMPIYIQRGVGREVDVAIIECAAVTEEGILLTTSVGSSDTFIRNAKKIILEVNTKVPMDIIGMHDIFDVGVAPNAKIIPITNPMDRIGTKLVPCDLNKIAAIVYTDAYDQSPAFKEVDETSQAISDRIVHFLKKEVEAGRQPKNLCPLQSGVGSVANAVLKGLASSSFENMTMYTETFQESALELLEEGKFIGASTSALSLSQEAMERMFSNMAWYAKRIVMRADDISNHPEVIRRLGLISMNTPLEVDIYGHINSTHVMGTQIMNGIGGSGDFARNCGLGIFATPSTAKGGMISSIVPMVSHVDHTEHDTQIIVTEQGLADLRWKTPKERAELLIENCAHPDYKPLLREYYQCALKNAKGLHTPHDLKNALSWHVRFLETGSMK